MSGQHDIVSIRPRAKTAPCQSGLVPRRHRANKTSFVNTTSCQHDTVSIRCRVSSASHQHDVVSNTTSCHHDVFFQDGVVSKQCRANTKPFQTDGVPSRHCLGGDAVPTRYRLKTVSWQTQRPVKTPSSQDDAVSKRCPVNTMSCQKNI